MPEKNYSEILEDVLKILERFAKPSEKISEETELVRDLELDSLQVMEIVQEVEDSFDILFPLNDISGIRTVKDFVLKIQKEANP